MSNSKNLKTLIICLSCGKVFEGEEATKLQEQGLLVCPNCKNTFTTEKTGNKCELRESSHHWIELWWKGLAIAIGAAAVSLSIRDLWDLLSTHSYCCKIVVLLISLIISMIGTYAMFIHHWNLQKKIDEMNGRIRKDL